MLTPRLLVTGLWALLPGLAGAAQWSDFRQPSVGAPAAIGRYNAGCLAGGQVLPLQGEGYQVMRVARNRYYGHANLVRYITRLGEAVAREKLGVMLVGDLSMPRGGPFTSGHRSHQTGLDADIALRLDVSRLPVAARDHVELTSVVQSGRYAVDPDRWSSSQARLIELAAIDSDVARIFVHPAIKQALCRSVRGDRAWLRKVRPWFGHQAHIHVRLHCPVGESSCISQPNPPRGDGCDAELASWFPDPNRKPEKSWSPKPAPRLPSSCLAMLRE